MDTVVKSIQHANSAEEIYAILEGKTNEQLSEIANKLGINCESKKKDALKIAIIRGLK